MALKKALTDIADKIRSHTGKNDKISLAAMPAEIENVYKAGKTEHDSFWDSMLDKGERTNFATAFAGVGWNDTTFRPPYDMTPSGSTSSSAASMFNACRITDLAGILSSLGRKIDFSKAKSLRFCFSNSKITHLPWLDISSAETIESLCSGCTELEKIEGITLSETTIQKFTTAFRNCGSLRYIRWNGGCIKSDVDLSSTFLDKASIIDTVKAAPSFEKNASFTSRDGEGLFNLEAEQYYLIKLLEPSDNPTEHIATWWLDYPERDEETGDYVNHGWTETRHFDEYGECVIRVESSYGGSFEGVTTSDGKKVGFSVHEMDATYSNVTITLPRDMVDWWFSPYSNNTGGVNSTEWRNLIATRPFVTISLM
jgi:hypothetical protein